MSKIVRDLRRFSPWQSAIFLFLSLCSGFLNAAAFSASKRRYSAQELESIQKDSDIVSLVESYGLDQFRRTYQNRATCICPFHNDNNPSLSIDGNRGIFKCFACGVGGNGFTFVREMAAINGEEISFQQAVEIVKEFGPRYPKGAFNMTSQDVVPPAFAISTQNQTSHRVLLANLAASAFFETSLASLPAAGVARSYLRRRNLNARTTKTFGIGYAPDAYFRGKERGTKWGEGSLVQHLELKGFTIAEMLAAGLVLPTKRASEVEPLSASVVVDRFRGKVIIPILDTSGRYVLGFGARSLDLCDTSHAKSNWTEPKYINSPESAVFQKKNILFGAHLVSATPSSLGKSSENRGDKTIVIVEGYLDAVALWQAGIKEVAACMGTSLTSEQLNVAADIAGNDRGKITLCLDNDEAGLASVERLCGSNTFFGLQQKKQVEIFVANLPVDTKDPAEFCENRGSVDAKAAFRAEVLETALPWTDWYLERLETKLLQNCTADSKEKVEIIFNQFASFLSQVDDIEEKDLICKKIAAAVGKLGFSEEAQVQIESTLLAKSDIIRSKFNDEKERPKEELSKVLARLAPRLEADWELTTRKTRDIAYFEQNKPDKMVTKSLGKHPSQKGPKSKAGVDSTSSKEEAKPILTPHFSGFHFQDPNDRLWISDSLSLTTRDKGKGAKKPIYFNSNEYHGRRFLSPTASRAGYKMEYVKGAQDAFSRGMSSLIEFEAENVRETLEDELLQTLVQYPESRAAMRETVKLSEASQLEATINWSSKERKALFQSLLNNESDSHMDNRSVDSKNLLVLERDGNFSTTTSKMMDGFPSSIGLTETPRDQFSQDKKSDSLDVGMSKTTSDEYLIGWLNESSLSSFVESESSRPSPMKLATRIQEGYYGLLLLNVMREAESSKESNVLERNEGDSNTSGKEIMGSSLDMITTKNQSKDSVTLLKNIIRSFNRRLVEEAAMASSTSKDEFRASYDELVSQLDKHMVSLSQRAFEDASCDREDESYEDVLERTLEEWGDLYYDDHFWHEKQERGSHEPVETPTTIVPGTSSPPSGQDDVESLDEFEKRIDDDWGDYLES